MKIYIIPIAFILLINNIPATIINIPDDYPTISEGVAASISGDTVLVSPGEYTEDINFEGKNILLTSLHGPDATALRCRIYFEHDEDSTCVLRGFYVCGPPVYASILCDGNSSPIIEGNIIANHDGYSGAGINVFGSTCIIRNNIFRNNINLCGGGAILIEGGGTLITENIFYENISYGYGGRGGAIELVGHSDISYNLFYNNEAIGNIAGAVGMGGGIIRIINPQHQTGITHIINNTFYGNKAIEDESHGIGGAIYNYSSHPADTLIILNNIIANNIASTGIGTGAYLYLNDSMYFQWDYNCIYENTIDSIEPGLHDIFADPMFVDTAALDFQLQAGSPCIDAGDPSYPLDPDSTRIDIGALFYDQSTDIDDEANNPYSFELHQNYPNPFNAQTIISYSLPDQAEVSLHIYDITGRLVKTLIDSKLAQAGEYSIIWNATDNSGSSVATAIYFYQLSVDNNKTAKSMIMIK